MKQVKELKENWYLREAKKRYKIPRMPMQVHELLYAYHEIDASYLWGKTENCRWINEKTWIYETEFTAEGERAVLSFAGLDTICSIWLNEEKIGESEDCYLPMQLSVLLKKGKNYLKLVFPPLAESFEQIQKKYGKILDNTSVKPWNFIRKTFHDFTNYLGNDADFYKIGVFRPISLLLLEEGTMLQDLEVSYTLNESLQHADVEMKAEIFSWEVPEDLTLNLQIAFQGHTIWQAEGKAGQTFTANLEKLHLWWPRGYGEQALYEVTAVLKTKEKLVDQKKKWIGFRKIQMQDMLDFSVNQVPIKLWGANLTPDTGHTLCEDSKRMERLLDLAKQAHVNTLRIWGEGVPFSDFLYEYADQHGILLWQEFFCGHTQYPNCKEVTDKILKEAEDMIKRLKHHPSVLLWCGGNECYLSRDFAEKEQEYLAASLFEYDLKRLCHKLDPDRYYHINSPFFGNYANEPSRGDTHSYTNSWYVPGSKYPVFASENLRVCFPKESSLKKYLKTQTLPMPEIQKHGNLPWPKEYEQITSAESYKKLPPIEHFYDSETPEEMIYRFGMAAGMYIKISVEGYRRGKRAEESLQKRRCKGHFIWKWNTTFPHIYSSVLDAYLEPKIPYYFLKRAYEPRLLSIEASDHIYIWAVNDTKALLKGSAKLKLFDMQQNQFVEALDFPVQIEPGESRVIGVLDAWGQFTRDKILYGELLDVCGEVITQNHSFVDIERHLTFPAAKLELWQEQGEVCIQTDQFARCVELTGEAEGICEGWDFSDNYFDLFPGEIKRIKISNQIIKGKLRAKAFYSPYVESIPYCAKAR